MQIVYLPAHPDLAQCWENIFPHVQNIQPHLESLSRTSKDSWQTKGTVTSDETLAPVHSFASSCLGSIKSIATEFLHAIQFVLEEISKYGNKEISIPVISGLYKSLVGHEMTAFDAISLILGIVANTVTTIITGKPPPIIAGLKASDKKSDKPTQYESGMPRTRQSDMLAGFLDIGSDNSTKPDPEDLLAFRTLMNGLQVAKLYLGQMIDTFKMLKRIAEKDLGIKPSTGFMDCFTAVCGGISTIRSLPAPDMPGWEIRAVVSILPYGMYMST